MRRGLQELDNQERHCDVERAVAVGKPLRRGLLFLASEVLMASRPLNLVNTIEKASMGTYCIRIPADGQ